MKKVFVLLLLCTSLILCFLLGSQMLLHRDFYYLSDQARDFMLVKSIVIDHKLTLIGSHSGLGGLFHGPLWLYMLVPIFILGKGNPLVFAYGYLLLALSTVVAGFAVGRALYGKWFGVLAALLLGINPILWHYIPNTIGINVMPLLYLFFILSSVVYMRGNEKALILTSCITGLAFQFETASAVAMVPLLILVLFLGKRLVPSVKTLLVSSVAFLLSLATFILFDLRHHFLIFKATLQLFNKNQGHKDYGTFLQLFTDHSMTLKNVYLSVFSSQHTLLSISGACIFVYFVYLIISKKAKVARKEFFFFLLTPLFVFLFYTFYPHPIYPEYVLDMTLSLVFAMSMMLVAMWSKSVGKLLALLFLLLTALSVVSMLQGMYGHRYIADTTSGSYQNQKRVADWIWKDARGKPFSYFVYTPETYTYGMDYLFWWEAKIHHAQIPLATKTARTYVILYPPLQNDANAHRFWMQNTLHISKDPISKKVFPGTIIVEIVDVHSDTVPVDPNYYQSLIFR